MTDMTVSFLFIVIILLAFFATQIAPEDAVSRKEYDRVVDELRERKQELDARDLHIASLLKQLEMFNEQGDDLIPWLQSENARLLSVVAGLKNQMARIEESLKLSPGDDASNKIAEILDENVRLRAQLVSLERALELAPDEDALQKISQLRQEIELLHRLLEEKTEKNPIEEYNARVSELRGQLLRRIQKRISALDAGIEVTLSGSLDALQFKGDGLFASGREHPSRSGQVKMEKIAEILNEELSCFALGNTSTIAEACNPAVALINSLQVEGHTDSDGTDIHNMGLSSKRGANIFGIMTQAYPELLEYKNLRTQPVLSVAGYGEGRPIADEKESGGKDANRRIDLRLIMYSPPDEQSIPQSIDDINRVRAINGGAATR